jgi:hypothetical protein
LDHNELGLDTLLDLDGEVFAMGNGFWVRFNARRAPSNQHVPHGIKYALTLHDRYNRRIVGYDNAHAIRLPRKKKFSGKRDVWDHKHERTLTVPYEFERAYQLLEDFWNDVNAFLEPGGV